MAEDVGEFDDVVSLVVEGLGEEVAEVVREDFPRCDAGLFAEGFHLGPDLLSIDGFTASGEENLAGSDFLFSSVFEKLPAELAGEQNRPDFPFQGDFSAAEADGFNGKVFHFTDPDAGRTDRFEEEGEAVFAEAFGGRDQAVEFIAGQLAGVVPEGAALEFKRTGAAIGPAGES